MVVSCCFGFFVLVFVPAHAFIFVVAVVAALFVSWLMLACGCVCWLLFAAFAAEE